MKIVYIPLDERPCNTVYPVQAAETAKDVNISVPKMDLLGKKKTPGDTKGIKKFLLDEAKDVDAAVISTETLVYGGLVPSRLHHLGQSDLNEYKKTIQQLKEINPELKVYVSNLIMRTPRYSSNDEEPDYYGKYGTEIFRYGWLKDKVNRDGLLDEEEQEMTKLETTIPTNMIKDYEERRQFNVKVNQLNISLLEEEAIDFLVIPQDDAAEYGYTAMDQQKVFQALNTETSQHVMIYPGADEVGFSLLARAYLEQKKKRLKIYVLYSSTFGPFITPNYEDRPINETLKAHVMASGGELVCSPDEADVVLAYNTPGKKMQESWEQEGNKDVSYSSYRHLPTFVRDIKNFLDKGLPVLVADSAYSNGGDGELIVSLDSQNLFEQLTSYKAWNTNGNTLGSTLSSGVFAYENGDSEKVKQNLLLHFYEDFIYQAIVRMDVTNEYLPEMDLNYFDLGNKKDEVAKIVKEKMVAEADNYLKNDFQSDTYDLNIDFPWNRMFEIYCDIKKS